MPAWDDYKTEAKSRGALALELYVAQTSPVDPDKMRAIVPDHLAYQSQLESEGALVFAGPMSDESGNEMQGMGMIVYRAASLEDAKALADNDPMHAKGARSYTLRKWLINEGSMTLSVRLSGQSVALA